MNELFPLRQIPGLPLKFYFACNFTIPAGRGETRFGLNFFGLFLFSREERDWGLGQSPKIGTQNSSLFAGNLY
jgi:hypothetical protein